MKEPSFLTYMTRRRFVQWSACGALAGGAGLAFGQAPGTTTPTSYITLRDCFWVWAHEAGVYNGAWGLPGNSRITPVEGAYYLGVPNIIFIRYEGKPAPPFEQYAVPFKSLRRVNWSITGAGGATSDEERKFVFRLAESMPNLTGVFMDDFFQFSGETGATPAALSVEQLRRVRQQLKINGRQLDVGVTLYTHQLNPGITAHLEWCDVVSLWTWKSEDLPQLPDRFAKLKQMVPAKRIRLGLYMWDFGINKPMPLDRMKQQCEWGLEWLKEGRIEGLIFLATNICDLNLETVEWTRHWISQVADQPLPN